jgi:hypothetical protein
LPPTIDNVVSNNCGQVLDIFISDIGIGVESVETAWRKGNGLSGFANTANPPEQQTVNRWQLLFSEIDSPPDSINLLGYELRIIVADSIGNADTMLSSIAGCIPADIDGGSKISAENWLGGDGRDSLWHLVSFPGSLPAYQVNTIFDEFSSLPPTQNVNGDSWRLYEYHNNAFHALVTDEPAAVIQPGQGYWFRHISVLDTLRLDNTDNAATWPTVSPFEIALVHGWNLVGSPFLFPVYINDTLIDIDSLSSFIRQDNPATPGGNNWWAIFNIGSALPQLRPWQGYALWCENPGGYSIYLDPHYAPQGAVADNRIATIRLSSPAGLIGSVDFGICQKSREGPDLTDVRPVTLFNKQSGMYIVHEPYGSFIRDIRPQSDIQVWRLAAEDRNKEPLTFSWSSSALSEPGKLLILHDAITGNTIDMTTQTSWRIENPGQMPDGRFSIFRGNTEAVKSAIEANLSPIPMTLRLYQNYPNPFNPKTRLSYDVPTSGQVTIEIFNILGQRVNTLLDKYQESGSYQVIWDGRDSRARQVATGIYFARLSSSPYSSTIKMSLVK